MGYSFWADEPEEDEVGEVDEEGWDEDPDDEGLGQFQWPEEEEEEC